MITAISDIRPNRLTEVKDERYHNQWGRYGVGAWYNTPLHQRWIAETLLNEQFYQGDQWIVNEDIEIFLKDESNDTRNRLQIVKNMIKPIVESYRGNAIRMDIGATARSISPMSITRKEKSLAENLFHTEVARALPQFSEVIKKGRPVGNTPQETEQIHENVYVDRLVEAMNDLLECVADTNNFDALPVKLALSMAFSGLASVYNFEYNGTQRFKFIQSKDYFWDRNAREPDLSDKVGEGYFEYWSPTQVYETCPNLTKDQREIIENYDKRSSATGNYLSGGNNSSRTGIPVATVFWRDTEVKEYAYVRNRYGDIVFHEINFVEDGETEAKYTTKDVVDPPDTKEARKNIKKGQRTCRRFPEVWRYCKFIPWEAAADPTKKHIPDTVLEWGLVPYQENQLNDYNYALSPIKNYAWSYINGEVISPIKDAISPQRFINRTLSVLDQQVRNSGGTGPIIDTFGMMEQDQERQVVQDMAGSKPVMIDLKGRGVQNTVGTYDTTVKAGSLGMFNLIEGMGQILQEGAGTNDALQGQTENSNGKQAVGFTQLMIQRGSLVQEPFYYAIEMVMLQLYQAIGSRGKRIYIDSEETLVKAVGDDNARAIQLSEDMRLEEFRVFIKRDNSPELLIAAGDELLNFLSERQKIDDTLYADLLGRSTPTQIANAMRSFVKVRMEMSRMQGEEDKKKEAAQEQMAIGLMQKQDQKEEMIMADQNLDKDKQAHNKLEQIVVKAQANAAFSQK